MPARILVIEDNPANLELMTYLLKAFGYVTISGTDGPWGSPPRAENCPTSSYATCSYLSWMAWRWPAMSNPTLPCASFP